VLQEALSLLSAGVEKVRLRSDTAGYQHALLRYCEQGEHERFGRIEFAIGCDVTAEFKKAVLEAEESEWYPVRKIYDGVPTETNQQWAIEHFNVLQSKEISGVTDEALACLMTYTYPGNIRELENIIERAFILCKSGMIDRNHLPEPVCCIPGAAEIPAWDAMSFRDMEAIFLTNALRRNSWNKNRTAQELGIHKSTLFRKLKALAIRQTDKGRNKA